MFRSISKYLALALAIANLAVSPVEAADIVVVDTNYAGWQISLHQHSGTCSMSRKHTDGTVSMYGFSREGGGWWFGFGRDTWHMRAGSRARLSFRLDGRPWSGDFTVIETGEALVSDHTLKLEFMRQIALSNRIDIYRADGSWLTALSLDGTYDAIGRVVACQEAQGWEPVERPRATRQPKTYTY